MLKDLMYHIMWEDLKCRIMIMRDMTSRNNIKISTQECKLFKFSTNKSTFTETNHVSPFISAISIFLIIIPFTKLCKLKPRTPPFCMMESTMERTYTILQQIELKRRVIGYRIGKRLATYSKDLISIYSELGSMSADRRAGVVVLFAFFALTLQPKACSKTTPAN